MVGVDDHAAASLALIKQLLEQDESAIQNEEEEVWLQQLQQQQHQQQERGGEDDDDDDDGDGEYGQPSRRRKASNARRQRRLQQSEGINDRLDGGHELATAATAGPGTVANNPSKKRRKVSNSAAGQSQSPQTASSTSSDPTQTNPLKPKNNAVANGMNTGPFSDEEERLFLEGLELYGREWGKIEKHVKSRPQPSIRSHAQKHFIKLFRDGLPLPAKVAESGTGFTLSGKELDVNSASARGYLNAGKVRRQSSSSSTLVAPSPPTMSSTAAAPPPILSSHKFLLPNSAVLHQQGRIISVDKMYKPQDLDLTNFVGVAATTTTTNSSNIASSLPTSKKKKQDDGVKIPSRLQEKNVLSSHTTPVVPITRPRRAASAKNVYGDSDPHSLHTLTPYLNEPLSSSSPDCQPFKIKVDPIVLAMIDFHAHLMQTEIIGFVAGDWNGTTRVLTITSAFPCRGLEGEEGVQGGGDDKDNNSCSGHHHHQDSSNTATSRHTNVEMDPTSEVEVRAKIRNIGKNVVGWYHSHPTFDALPSLIDLENQRNYQMLFQEDQDGEDGGNGGEVGGTGGRMVGGDEPFVGIIVAPYDPKSPTSQSSINWFYVGNAASHETRRQGYGDGRNTFSTHHYNAKQLSYTLFNDEIVRTEGIHEMDYNEMIQLVKQCSVKKDKTLLNTKWSHSKDETRLEKLFKCLKFRLFDEARLKRRLQSTLQFPQAMDVVEEKEKGTVGDDDDVLTTAHTDGKSDVGVDVSLILSRVSAIKALEELEIELKSCFIT